MFTYAESVLEKSAEEWYQLILPNPKNHLITLYSYVHNIIRDIYRHLHFVVDGPQISTKLDVNVSTTFKLEKSKAASIGDSLGVTEEDKKAVFRTLDAIVKHVNEIDSILAAHLKITDNQLIPTRRDDKDTPWLWQLYEMCRSLVRSVEEHLEPRLVKLINEILDKLDEQESAEVWQFISSQYPKELPEWISTKLYKILFKELPKFRNAVKILTDMHYRKNKPTFDDQLKKIPEANIFSNCAAENGSLGILYALQLLELTQLVPSKKLDLHKIEGSYFVCFHNPGKYSHTTEYRKECLTSKNHNYVSKVNTDPNNDMPTRQAYDIVKDELKNAHKFIETYQNPLMIAGKAPKESECLTELLDRVRETVIWGLENTVLRSKQEVDDFKECLKVRKEANNETKMVCEMHKMGSQPDTKPPVEQDFVTAVSLDVVDIIKQHKADNSFISYFLKMMKNLPIIGGTQTKPKSTP
ncbi:hypothetical protein Ddc_15422 [Ditylenchus destructor]|nr:hypothetical protein Ddc_15422 [Ditylenchus destructor]